VCDLSNDPQGIVRLKAFFHEWEIFNDLLKVFGVNLALNRRAARGAVVSQVRPADTTRAYKSLA
jgi:hypothetical protein